MEILQVQDLDIGYKDGKNITTVISHLNLSLNKGEMVCLLGANGKGKSTLLRTISGTQAPLHGDIRINGKDISSLSKRNLSQLLGLVYTDHTMAGGLTVRELVELGRQPHTGFLGRLSQYDNLIVSKAMKDTGIYEKRDSFVSDLSDGERQKSMIAKALAQETPLIFLDEPTAFLDVASKIETLYLLHNLVKEQNKSIIFSSHDVSQSILLADKLWIIDNSGKITSGITEDIILSGALSTLFDSNNIVFDISNGTFKHNERFDKSVTVYADNDILRHWVCNALRRVGIEPYNVDEDAQSQLNVYVNDKDKIIISKNQETLSVCKSIGELIEELARCFNTKI